MKTIKISGNEVAVPNHLTLSPNDPRVALRVNALRLGGQMKGRIVVEQPAPLVLCLVAGRVELAALIALNEQLVSAGGVPTQMDALVETFPSDEARLAERLRTERAYLTDLESADLVREFRQKTRLSETAIGRYFNKTQPWVTQLLAASRADTALREAIQEGLISLTAAIAFMGADPTVRNERIAKARTEGKRITTAEAHSLATKTGPRRTLDELRRILIAHQHQTVPIQQLLMWIDGYHTNAHLEQLLEKRIVA